MASIPFESGKALFYRDMIKYFHVNVLQDSEMNTNTDSFTVIHYKAMLLTFFSKLIHNQI